MESKDTHATNVSIVQRLGMPGNRAGTRQIQIQVYPPDPIGDAGSIIPAVVIGV
jgi:hypothetical protein